MSESDGLQPRYPNPNRPFTPDISLPRSRDRERALGNVVGYGRASCDECIVRQGDRRDQIGIATHESAIADSSAALLDPVVIHDDRAASEAHLHADVSVTNVRKMGNN